MATAGPIAFLTLAAPQIARRLTRAPGPPLLCTALTGAALLPAADLPGRTAPFGLVAPAGLVARLLGGGST